MENLDTKARRQNYQHYELLTWHQKIEFSEVLVNAFYTRLSFELAGGDIIDGGCNVGYHAVPLSYIASRWRGRIVCVDPNERSLEHCRSFFDWIYFTSYNLIKAGVSDHDSVGYFVDKTTGDRPNEESFCLKTPPENSTQRIVHPVQLRNLDSIVAELGLSPRIIKLDLEGFELHAFAGMTETLKHRPIVSFEFPHGSYSPTQIQSAFYYFARHHYVCFDIFGQVFDETDWNLVGPWNRFAVPVEIAHLIPQVEFEFQKIHSLYSP